MAPQRLCALLFLTTALCLSTAAQAQGADPAPRPGFGGLGYFSPGVMLGRVGGTGGLSTPRALGAGAQLPGSSLQLGGGGRALLGDLLLGGKGFGYDFGQTSTAQGRASLAGGGGGLDVGYTLSRQDSHLAYGYLGVGGMGFSMEITNHGKHPLELDGVDILPGQRTTLTAGALYGEAGMGAHWLLLGAGGGPCLGLEAGALFKLNGGRWEDKSGHRALALQRAGWNGFFLRLTVGGGGFWRQ